MAAAAPRMTAANPFHRQPASGQRAVAAKGGERVFRAAWGETAVPLRAEDKDLGRGNHPAVTTHAEN